PQTKSPRDVIVPIVLATLGAAPFLIALMAYHQAAFGHPLHSGYKYLADAAYQPWHVGGFLGIRFPDPRAFFLSFFSSLRGFFTLAPFLLMAAPGLVLHAFRAWPDQFARLINASSGSVQAAPAEAHGSANAIVEAQDAGHDASAPAATGVPGGDLSSEQAATPERSLFWSSLLLLLWYAYFTSSFTYDSWGWTTGPRHLTGLVPFLLLPAGLFLEWLRAQHQRAYGVGLGLCSASVLVTGGATLVNYIPDNVSNALFGLTLPLLRAGYTTPTALFLLSAGTPWLGLGLALLLLVAASLIARRAWPAAAITLLLVLGAHALSYQASDGDKGAVQHLKSTWMTPPPS
ncbi:MAG: hypothetical protein ACT4TC_03585, partial [Myxococcaceae bacterium]